MLYLLLQDNLVFHLALIDNHNIYEVPLCAIYVYSTIYTYAIKNSFVILCLSNILSGMYAVKSVYKGHSRNLKMWPL